MGAGGKTGVGGGGAGVGAGGSSGQMTSPHPSGSAEQVIWSALGPEHFALHVSMMKLHRTHTVEFGMWMGFETMAPGGHAGSGVGMPMPAETGTMSMLTMASAVRAKDTTRDEGINFILQNKGMGWDGNGGPNDVLCVSFFNCCSTFARMRLVDGCCWRAF